MAPEQWERLTRLYEAASALPVDERMPFLRETCKGNDPLREEVQSLLASEAAAGDFLNAGALHDAARLLVQDNLHSLVGECLDSYEVLSLVGSGGMGEVYRAHDSRLGRDVAIKVLPALVTRSADARSRFEREARAVAAMSHPNIRSLYDVGESHGRMYAVMELLEGETLRARLKRGPLALRKTVEISAAIADGLAAAHAKGIVHRDLKPENVFITTDGAVKVLDFGLAQTQEPIGPQEVKRHTRDDEPGGTFGYMSPEQASGGKIDARSDLFSFGCVLYEMVIGRRSFERHTAPQLTAAILNEEPPDLGMIRADLRRIIAHCLEKEPHERFQSAQDLAFHLRSLNVTDANGRRSARARDRRATALIGGIVIVIAAFAAWLLWPSDPGATVQSYLMPPPDATFNFDAGLAISPDGRSVAYVARSSDEPKESLWVHPLNGAPARRLAGTDEARFPFWSPDSRSLAFFARNSLMRIETSGGAPRRLCTAVGVNQGAWGAANVIVFGGYGSGLRQVSAAGGGPFPVTELDSSGTEEGHGAPVFLRDGRRLLFRTFANSDPSIRGIYSMSLASKRSELVSTISGSSGRVSKLGIADGYVLFIQEGRLLAAPFDDGRARLKAQPTRLTDHVGTFSLSASGILVYGPRLVTELGWVDRRGQPLEAPRIRGDFAVPSLSHDGRRIAVMNFGESDTADVWVYDVATGTGIALTNHPAHDGFPLWSPDDEWIYFHSDRTGRYELYRKRSTGLGTEESVLAWDAAPWATSWSRDGALILSDSRPEAEDLWQLAAGRSAVPLFKTPFKEWAGQMSPDGHTIAYNSNQTGQPEIFVRSFPPSGDAIQVTTGGGMGPKWRGDGKELFFIDGGGRMMALDVPLRANLEHPQPRPLFELSMMRRMFAPRTVDFDVAPDGQRFLIVRIAPEAGRRPLTVVQNWTAGLKK